MDVFKSVATLVALLTVAAIIGSASASAYTNYVVPNGFRDISTAPRSFFVNSLGQPNAKIVIGDSATALEAAGAGDIAASMGNLLYYYQNATNAGVVLQEVIPPRMVSRQVIYRYDYYTMIHDHHLPYNGGLVNWSTSYSQLPSDYWYNGGKYTGNYSQWLTQFNTSFYIKNKDSVNGSYLYGWEIDIKRVSLVPIQPFNWNESAPPIKANLDIPPAGIGIVVNYQLYNYSTVVRSETNVYSEWGVPPRYVNRTFHREGNLADVKADNGSVNSVLSKGVVAGQDFTLLGKDYHVFNVGNGSFTAGRSLGTQWFVQDDGQRIGNSRWMLTLLGASQINGTAMVVVTNTLTGQSYGPFVLMLGVPEDVIAGNGSVELELCLNALYNNLIKGVIAQISAYSDVRHYRSGEIVKANGQEWIMNIETQSGVIKQISLVNAKDIVGNPIDLFNIYNVEYSFTMKSLNEMKVDYDINHDGNVTNTSYVVASASISVVERNPVVITQVVKVGNEIPGTPYRIVGLQGVRKVIPMTPTKPVVILGSQVNFANPSSNYVLVGTPWDNALIKAVFSKYNLPTDKNDFSSMFGNTPVLGYIPHCSLLGGRGVIIVTGSSPKVVNRAAQDLMGYIATFG
ncbi:MAG: S-layer protein [Thermococci archaeon]|nr:S-layer protein [Thermococci archaeon]